MPQKETYKKWAAKRKDLPLFFQAWWLDIVCGGTENWNVIMVMDQGGERVEGIFTYFQKRRLGLLGIDMPPFTPMMGPLLFLPDNMLKQHSIRSFEVRVLSTLREQLPSFHFFRQKWSWQINNHLPFYWNHYRIQTNYTYLFPQIGNLDQIWQGFSKNVRGRIRQKKELYKIVNSDDITSLYLLQQNRLEQQGISMPLSRDRMEDLFKALQKNDAGRVYNACTANAQIVASIMVVYDQQEAYLLLAASEDDGKSGAMPILIWQAIQDLQSQVKRFNFEGSMLPGVEQFFRSFGADLTPYYMLKKIGLPLLNKYY